MSEAMLRARLALVDRIRVVEHVLARADQSRMALELLGEHAHRLGNSVQIVDLASLELERRRVPEVAELVADVREGATNATAALAAMLALAQPRPRPAGPPVAPAIAAAIELARPAVAAALELRVELGARVACRLAAAEIEALVLAAVLDATAVAGPAHAAGGAAAHDPGATRIAFELGERTIDGVRWIELLRVDDRAGEVALDLAPPSFAAVVAALAAAAGGEVSLAPGRGGHELAIALRVV
jgi:hypothetical protein